MGKVEIGIYFRVTADFWQKFYRNVSGLVLYQPYEFCPNRWLWLVAMATERLNYRKQNSKIFFSEAISGMKLKLCINIHDISLYINFIFYCRCPCAFVAMAIWSFHRLIMEKVEIGIYLLLQIFWQKFYWNVSGVVLYQLYEFCPNHWF